MAVDNISTATQASGLTAGPAGANPNGILGKDDFLKLLLVELQYQDPTEPMDSEKILSQTSELASLEASENTNKALQELAASLSASRNFSTVSAIGKIADTGSNAIVYEDGSTPLFELYFADEVQSGSINVLDTNGNIIRTMSIDAGTEGIAQFEWDGKDEQGDLVEEGTYYIEANYKNDQGKESSTRIGLYPIESVKFEEGETLLKLGSNYVPFDSIKEIKGS